MRHVEIFRWQRLVATAVTGTRVGIGLRLGQGRVEVGFGSDRVGQCWRTVRVKVSGVGLGMEKGYRCIASVRVRVKIWLW